MKEWLPLWITAVHQCFIPAYISTRDSVLFLTALFMYAQHIIIRVISPTTSLNALLTLEAASYISVVKNSIPIIFLMPILKLNKKRKFSLVHIHLNQKYETVYYDQLSRLSVPEILTNPMCSLHLCARVLH